MHHVLVGLVAARVEIVFRLPACFLPGHVCGFARLHLADGLVQVFAERVDADILRSASQDAALIIQHNQLVQGIGVDYHAVFLPVDQPDGRLPVIGNFSQIDNRFAVVAEFVLYPDQAVDHAHSASKVTVIPDQVHISRQGQPDQTALATFPYVCRAEVRFPHQVRMLAHQCLEHHLLFRGLSEVVFIYPAAVADAVLYGLVASPAADFVVCAAIDQGVLDSEVFREVLKVHDRHINFVGQVVAPLGAQGCLPEGHLFCLAPHALGDCRLIASCPAHLQGQIALHVVNQVVRSFDAGFGLRVALAARRPSSDRLLSRSLDAALADLEHAARGGFQQFDLIFGNSRRPMLHHDHARLRMVADIAQHIGQEHESHFAVQGLPPVIGHAAEIGNMPPMDAACAGIVEHAEFGDAHRLPPVHDFRIVHHVVHFIPLSRLQHGAVTQHGQFPDGSHAKPGAVDFLFMVGKNAVQGAFIDFLRDGAWNVAFIAVNSHASVQKDGKYFADGLTAGSAFMFGKPYGPGAETRGFDAVVLYRLVVAHAAIQQNMPVLRGLPAFDDAGHLGDAQAHVPGHLAIQTAWPGETLALFKRAVHPLKLMRPLSYAAAVLFRQGFKFLVRRGGGINGKSFRHNLMISV
nr:MAG TPA: hypothetical protein [Caudoviricetes sp.]DAX45034.1 MAG TPA: hypothetical protein [Caudoviricetes sp.]